MKHQRQHVSEWTRDEAQLMPFEDQAFKPVKAYGAACGCFMVQRGEATTPGGKEQWTVFSCESPLHASTILNAIDRGSWL